MQAGLPMGSARCATIRPREMQSRANLAPWVERADECIRRTCNA